MQNAEADVWILGSGSAGISTACELVSSVAKVTMHEAREVLPGESGRTKGHLSSALDDGCIPISEKYGNDGANWSLKTIPELRVMLARLLEN